MPSTVPPLNQVTRAVETSSTASNRSQSLVGLPPELLLSIFKFQDTVIDVLHLCSTCKYLHEIWQSESETMLDAILPQEVTCYQDALSLAEAQRAFGLIGTQKAIVRVVLPDKVSPLPWSQTLRPLPQSSTQILYSRLRANAREADYVCSLATERVTPARAKHNCSVHPPHLLLHERQRLIHCWYFVKLYTLSYFSPSLRESCDATLTRMSLVEAYITWDLTFWLCEVVDLEYSEKLGIWDNDPPFDPVYEYIQENSEVPEWLRRGRTSGIRMSIKGTMVVICMKRCCGARVKCADYLPVSPGKRQRSYGSYRFRLE